MIAGESGLCGVFTSVTEEEEEDHLYVPRHYHPVFLPGEGVDQSAQLEHKEHLVIFLRQSWAKQLETTLSWGRILLTDFLTSIVQVKAQATILKSG